MLQHSEEFDSGKQHVVNYLQSCSESLENATDTSK